MQDLGDLLVVLDDEHADWAVVMPPSPARRDTRAALGMDNRGQRDPRARPQGARISGSAPSMTAIPPPWGGKTPQAQDRRSSRRACRPAPVAGHAAVVVSRSGEAHAAEQHALVVATTARRRCVSSPRVNGMASHQSNDEQQRTADSPRRRTP